MNVDPSGLSYSGGMITMDDSALDNAWMNNLSNINLNQAQMSFERAASNYLNTGNVTTTLTMGYSPNYSTVSYNSSPSNMMAVTFSVSSGGDVTPILGASASSSFYISNNHNGKFAIGSSYTHANSIGFGASLGVQFDGFRGDVNNQYTGESQTSELCFLVGCLRYHQTIDGKPLGGGIGLLTEYGAGFTHFKNNTGLFHEPRVIKKSK